MKLKLILVILLVVASASGCVIKERPVDEVPLKAEIEWVGGSCDNLSLDYSISVEDSFIIVKDHGIYAVKAAVNAEYGNSSKEIIISEYDADPKGTSVHVISCYKINETIGPLSEGAYILRLPRGEYSVTI